MVCHARPSFAAAALALLLAPWPLCAQQEPQRIEVLGHYETQVGTSDAASEGSVTARLIANRPALRPAEVLEFVPGVIVTQHSGDGKANQYFLRGFSLDHGTDFATWVDGMPINQPTHAHGHGYTDLNFLIPELVRRIDYRKGPYFAEEGDFSSVGSARIRLADVLPRGIAQLTFGEHAYRRVLLADSRTAGAGHLLGALELLLNDGPWRQPEDLRKWNGWLRWSQHGPARQRSLTLMAYDARWTATDQIPERAVAAGLVDRFGTLDPNDGGRSRRVSLSGRQHLQLHDGDLEVSAYAIASRLTLFSNFTYFLDDETRGDQFEQSESRRTVGGTASRRWQRPFFGRQADFTLGGQWRHDRLSPVGLHHTQARRRVDTAQESRVRQTQAGLYGELGLSWTPWLRSVAGLRADAARFDTRSSIAENSGRTSAHLVSPKLSLIAGPWSKTEVFFNAGRGFHSNDARGTVARVDPAGTSTDPVPGLAKSRGLELGLRSERLPGLQSSLALWRLDLDSELVFIGDAGSTEASAASHRRGIEWNNHWRFAREWLLDLDLAASRARYRPTPGGGGTRVPGAVNRVASLGLTWLGEGPWFGQFQLRHFGPRDLVEDGSQRSRGTTLASLRTGWRPAPGKTLTLDVFNLFDRRASDIDYFYESRAVPGGEARADRHFHPVEPRSARLTFNLQWR